jgi:hypothetical protein
MGDGCSPNSLSVVMIMVLLRVVDCRRSKRRRSTALGVRESEADSGKEPVIGRNGPFSFVLN